MKRQHILTLKKSFFERKLQVAENTFSYANKSISALIELNKILNYKKQVVNEFQEELINIKEDSIKMLLSNFFESAIFELELYFNYKSNFNTFQHERSKETDSLLTKLFEIDQTSYNSSDNKLKSEILKQKIEVLDCLIKVNNEYIIELNKIVLFINTEYKKFRIN